MEPDTLSRGGETAAGLQSKDNRGEKGEWGKKGGKERAKRTRRRERERESREGERKKGAKEGARRRRRSRRRRAKAKVNEKREIKRGEGGRIGSRTESFGLACLACYDGISEMVEPRHRHKKRLTMQKTLHPVAARSSSPTFGPGLTDRLQ